MAASGPRHAPPPFLSGPLPALPRTDVGARRPATFLRHPVRGFLRGRLDVALPVDEQPVVDGLPVEIDQLAQWGVGDRVLTDLLPGVDPARAREQEWRRGVLPPGRLGWRMLGDLVDRADPLAEPRLALRTRPATAVDVDVDLGDGRWLRGTVPGVYGDRLVPVSYSRLGATHRLQSWVRVLALAASYPDRNWTAHTIGRPTNSRSRDTHAVSLLGPVDDHDGARRAAASWSPCATAAWRPAAAAARRRRSPTPGCGARRRRSPRPSARPGSTGATGASPASAPSRRWCGSGVPGRRCPVDREPPEPGEEVPGETTALRRPRAAAVELR